MKKLKHLYPICKSRKKFIHVSPDDGLEEQAVGNGSLFSCADDECETMWLSSGCISPESNLLLKQASEAEKLEGFRVDEPLLWPFDREIEGNPEAKSSTSTNIDSKDEIPESDMSLKQASEGENIEELNGTDDEPLFWPFERKLDWNSEGTWKHFTMSPRKDIVKITTVPQEITSDRSIGSELNNMNKNLQKLKQGSKIKKGNIMPSRLRESTKVSAKIVSLSIENQSKLGSVSTLWEDDFTSNEQVPIETVVGLCEFDGHEGIDSEFNGVFLLDETLFL